MTIVHCCRGVLIAGAMCLGLLQATQAQIPVTVTSDVPATVNQIETIAKWVEQLNAMDKQLDQMKQLYKTLQGGRNMGSLLNSDLAKQYLPEDFSAAARSLRDGTGAFAGISGSLDDIVRASQLRTCAELNLDASRRTQCAQQWQQLALQKHIGELGYRKAAENIRNLQTFVASINGSTDQKAISEVQARIQVETVRMQNEQMKLSTIRAIQEADVKLRRQAATDAFNAGLARGSAGGIRF
ncbi:P-type DNA transfer protein VirB5 [Variovorax paradoxus]|jgi:type IV secretion system protein VirB5|uniref:Type IV secretion system protein virB5 n=1 Tax=Variovorax paradoxus TaxID=34073 RepID=A0A679JE78_VARPD|nr:Type IV secretion system protein virB5 [Variovorax paradoxus]